MIKVPKYLNDPFVQEIISRESSNYEVQVIADSINNGYRISTLQLKYPRIIHGEIMTHRVFSRNAKSSRAIPTEKELQLIHDNPFIPIYWGKNQSGMQAKEELDAVDIQYAKSAWLKGLKSTLSYVEEITGNYVNLHKQIANRLLEPYQLMESVVTSTEWDNFFALRIHPDAQPEIIKLAYMMYQALVNSEPVETKYHLPYISDLEKVNNLTEATKQSIEVLQRISSARCARVSYKAFDGTTSIEKDLDLADKLFNIDFPHASPAEHPCIAHNKPNRNNKHANFNGWRSYRLQKGY